jgi:hypothetical protein
MTDPDRVWGALSRDPRVPENAALRASDADRDVVLGVLTEAYADGRITREEHDTRSSATQSARTLGDLVAPLEGLVSLRPTARGAALVPPAELDRRALDAWRKDRRDALWGLISVSAIVWTMWLVTSGVGSFPWPAFVTLAALLNVGRIQVQRTEIIRDKREHLERKQRKEIERRRREDDT